MSKSSVPLNINKFTLLALLILPLTLAQAALSDLTREFLGENSQVAKNQGQADLAKLQLPALEAQNSIFLRGEAGYDHNALKGQLGLQEYYARKVSLSLSKTFLTGTTISVENNLINNDQRRSPQVAEFLGIQNRFYEFQNVLKLSQDLGENFLGFRYRKELDLARLQSQVSQSTVQASNQGLLLEFYNDYIKARLNKTMVRLQQEGLERARKRRDVIAKRVRDGLLERRDLYKADLLVLGQQESLSKAKQELTLSLNELSQRLHRKVGLAEVEAYEKEGPQPAELSILSGRIEENKESLAMEKNVEYIQETISKIRYGYIPSVTLNALYKTNSNEPDWKTAVNEGKFGEGDKQVAFSINLTVPWGFESTKVQEARERINLMVKEREFRGHQENIKSLEVSLRENAQLLLDNIRSSQERRRVAENALGESNRLYGLGRALVDSVIVSEEELIRTEISLATYRASFDGTQGLLGRLYGKLENHLLNNTQY